MLKYRILTALVLIPLVVWGVLELPTPIFLLATGVFLALAAWEWAGLVPFVGRAARMLYVLVFISIAGLSWWALRDQSARLEHLLAAAVVWWLLAALWLNWPKLGQAWQLPKALLALIALLPVWLALGLLHDRALLGAQLALFVIVLMWVADSGAYFAGRSLGRHKLAPQVSPGKTWEGVLGGLLASGLFAWGAGLWFGWSGDRLLAFVVLALACVPLSVVGDLFISLLKRQQGLKDTGQLFPGHGGVLDRIDSLLAAAPAFVYGLTWLD